MGAKISVNDLLAAARAGAGDALVEISGTYERVTQRYTTRYDSGDKLSHFEWYDEKVEMVIPLAIMDSGIVISGEEVIELVPFGWKESSDYTNIRRRVGIRRTA